MIPQLWLQVDMAKTQDKHQPLKLHAHTNVETVSKWPRVLLISFWIILPLVLALSSCLPPSSRPPVGVGLRLVYICLVRMGTCPITLQPCNTVILQHCNTLHITL